MSLRLKNLKSGLDSLRGKTKLDGHGSELSPGDQPALPAKSPKKEHRDHHDEIRLPSSSNISPSTSSSRAAFSSTANVKIDKRIVSLPVILDEEAGMRTLPFFFQVVFDLCLMLILAQHRGSRSSQMAAHCSDSTIVSPILPGMCALPTRSCVPICCADVLVCLCAAWCCRTSTKSWCSTTCSRTRER